MNEIEKLQKVLLSQEDQIIKLKEELERVKISNLDWRDASKELPEDTDEDVLFWDSEDDVPRVLSVNDIVGIDTESYANGVPTYYSHWMYTRNINPNKNK